MYAAGEILVNSLAPSIGRRNIMRRRIFVLKVEEGEEVEEGEVLIRR